MSAKFHGDVRPLSHDSRYMGDGFVGTMDDAIAQAKAAPEFRLPPNVHARLSLGKSGMKMSRDRIALLQHLNLLPL